MTKREAKSILDKIMNNPSIADQFTEEEIEELERINTTPCGEEQP